MNRIIKYISFLFITILFFSCQVGLGEMVDILAPTINVNSPERAGYIQKSFTITGNAKDDTGVSSLLIKIEPYEGTVTSENSVQYKLVDNQWLVLNGETWVPYANYYSGIEGTAKDFKWWLTIESLPDASQTEYIITSQVFDAYKNEGKNSKDERSVTIDEIEPDVFSIISPSVKALSTAKTAFDTYTTNKNGYKESRFITNIVNGEFKVSGSQKENYTLDYLVVYIDDSESTTIADDIQDTALFYKKIDDDSLRNWSTNVDLSKIAGLDTGARLLRLVTESHDTAGNVQKKVQGWFTYWNDADVPWVTATFGGNSYENSKTVYPSCVLQGQAYDDDGLKSINVKIYKGNETIPVEQKDIDLTEENYPTYKAWTINALAISCDFRVEVTCKDINNKVSDKVIQYMSVTDTNPPSIVIETDTTKPMTGDKTGKITLSGYITDDGTIDTLKLFRVIPGMNSNDLVKFYDGTIDDWGFESNRFESDPNYEPLETDNYKYYKKFKDDDTKKELLYEYKVKKGSEEKIWKIKLGDETVVNGEHKRTFSIDLNIFTDFNIDGTENHKLDTQNFIIMATDGAGCQNIDSFTWAGDTTAPTVTIDEVEVIKKNEDNEKIQFKDYNETNQKKLKPFNRDENNLIVDKVVLRGKWKDETTDLWTDKTKHGQFKLKWNEIEIPVDVKSNGDWETEEIDPPDNTTASISVEFTDLAGNTVKEYEHFFISSNNPELLRISTVENDGVFKAGDTIHITLEFNKAVECTGTPVLSLNNGRVIPLPDGSSKNTNTYVFDYKVSSTDTNVSNLDVLKITGAVWKSDNLPVLNIKADGAIILSESNKLKKTRNIGIDTIAPFVKEIKAITSAGSYNAGKEIFLQIEFSEDVIINDPSKIKLGLNAAKNLKTSTATITGPKTVLVSFTVDKGQNTDKLEIGEKNISVAGITDNAGNEIVIEDNSIIINNNISGISIDTNPPSEPEISGVNDDDYIYDSKGVTITIKKFEPNSILNQYSLDGGVEWRDYTGPFSVTNNGEYNLQAKQQDAAGNESKIETKYHFNIDKGDILTSVTAGIPTGTYTTDDIIPIYLNFRKTITVTEGANLSLNLSNGKKAIYDREGSSDTKALFTYTIAEGDNSEKLNVTGITGEFTDENGKDVSSLCSTIPKGKNLEDSRIIKIITGTPTIKNFGYKTVNGKRILEIEFSTDISKGTGKNVEIEMKTGFVAPVVLSTAKYNTYLSAAPELKNYYDVGENGSSSTCVPDLTEKYILKYEINTDEDALVKALKKANADKVIIPINSTYAKVTGKVLQLELEGSYALPVKGAVYKVTIPADLVINEKNKGNLEIKDTYEITEAGIEKPYIRINKTRETIDTSTKAVTQPKTAEVKIDCQTPGVTCYYVVNSKENKTTAVTDRNTIYVGKKENPASIVETTLTSNNTTRKKYTDAFTIGSNDDSNTSGFIYLIGAKASKGSNWSETSYETAYKTAVVLTYSLGDDGYNYSWIRGGDSTYGGVDAKDFPFSWNTSEFDKVRAMTATGNQRYWITWSLNKVSYVGFVFGDMPNDATTMGPSKWVWGDCGFTHWKDHYPLSPGSSYTFNTSTAWAYGGMQKQEKKREYRVQENGVWVAKKGNPQ